jgi:methylthioribulose-1-phosphate dehydratase
MTGLDLRTALMEDARQFHQCGWMVGTAGNLSARHDLDTFWITASGRSKGRLTVGDFARVILNDDGSYTPHPEQLPGDCRPSAETSIHAAIYNLFPETLACYHVHSVEGNLISNTIGGSELLLPPLEMVKGFGIWEENPQAILPIFENYLEVPKIAAEIFDRFQIEPPALPALYIRNHGVTVWGKSTREAFHYIELIEYIFRYQWQLNLSSKL